MMAEIDIVELAATTNFVYRKLLESEALRSRGDGAGAVATCHEAVEAACRTMRDIFSPFLDEIADAASPEEVSNRIRQMMRNRDAIAEFLNAEEEALIQAGLLPALVETVMDRCTDFLHRNPDEVSIPDIRKAFAAARFLVCEDAKGRLTAAKKIHDKGTLRIYGRLVLRTAVGVTIIGVNYKIFGPAEWLFSVSSGYGASWLPTDVPG